MIPRAVPGGRYRLTASVKCSGTSHARVAAQWTHAGNWYGGSWPSFVPRLPANATAVWRELTQEFVVPEDADRGSVYVSVFDGYMIPDTAGTASWRDVSVVEVLPPLLRTVLVSPSYRGRVTAVAPAQLVVRAWVNSPRAAVPELEAALYARDGARGGRRFGRALALVKLQWPDTSGTPVELVFDESPQALLTAPGGYVIVVRAVRGTNRNITAAERTHTLTRVAAAAPEPAVTVDQRQRLVVDGKPFFPVGLYYSAYPGAGMNDSALELVGESAFNMIMPYDSETNLTATRLGLDLAHKHGIKVMVDAVIPLSAVVAERVQSLKDHPAVLGWYASDEAGLDSLPSLLELYKFLVYTDPGHPSWSVFTTGQVAHLGDFEEAFDVVGTDPYPIGQV